MPNTNGQPDRVSAEYLNLLRDSRTQLNTAIAINQFLERSVSVAYQMKQGDELNMETGEIARKAEEQPN